MRRLDRGFGCLQAAGIGCLALIGLAVVLGIVVYSKAESWARAAGATLVEAVTEQAMSEAGLSEEEKDSAREPVREFARKIRDGEVSAEQVAAVVEEFAEGGAWAVLLMRGFQTKYLEPSDLPEEEKAAGRVTVGRFVEGLLRETVPTKRLGEISDIVTYETAGPDGEKQHKLKDSITTEELRSSLSIMKDAADAAGVEDREFTRDIGEMIGQAIERGMAGTRDRGAPEVPEPDPADGTP
ncbi:MAG: hypothetical protein ACYTKD_27045 [Planctomycetota bacterium]|jgi:hypothetical protein